MKIAVLALQGAFIEHVHMLRRLGADTMEIRQQDDLHIPFDGLVIPGGESTVQGKLLRELGLFTPLQSRIRKGLPVFGTCAGLLLLAQQIEGENSVHLGTMSITARRNAYGRQLGSFFTEAPFGDVGTIPMTFIRAPYISSVTEGVDVLATVDGHMVAAREKNQLAISFHPELNDHTGIHRYFLEMVAQHKQKVEAPTVV